MGAHDLRWSLVVSGLLLVALSSRPSVLAQPPAVESSADAPVAHEGARPAGKAALAILPFQMADGSEVRRDIVLLQDGMTRTFVQSGKFDVIERAKIEAVIDENAFATSTLGDPANAAQLGRLIGAQYVVVGNVHELGLGVSQQRIPYVDEWKCTESARIRVELRVIQVKTGRIVAAHEGTASRSAPFTQRRPCGRAPKRILDEAIDGVTAGLTAKVVDAIYPLRVVRATADSVTLNRGEGGNFQVGSVLQCFAEGAEVVDPDTGDVLGHDEMPVGEVTVTAVRPRMSMARPADGTAIPVAAVCRVTQRVPQRKAPVKPKPQVNW